MPGQPNRITFAMTTVTRKRLEFTCAKYRAVEGAKVAPARILNELIMKFLEPHPDELEGMPQLPQARPKRKGAQLARTA